MRHVVVLSFLALVSCQHRNDEGFATASASAMAPVAVAGEDQKVVKGASVTLDGSRSSPAGQITYLWEQIGGATVPLSDATVASPTFTAPGTEDTLTFRLTVTGVNGTDADTVAVTVKTVVVNASDLWFVGYGKTGSMTVTASGGTGTYTYAWTGLNAWLSLSTAVGTNDTLNYATPLLQNLRSFAWERNGVLHQTQTTVGRLQLKVVASDSGGATDEDWVSFSAGPPSSSSVGENVAPGEPVFLYALDLASPTYAWTGVRPDGSAISFFKQDKTALLGATDQRFVYFVPDLTGHYRVDLAQSNPWWTVEPRAFGINCGTYVGTGSYFGKTPDYVKGECASCHRGAVTWLRDLATPWERTRHATAYSRLLDPADPDHAASQAKGRWQDAFDFGSPYSIDARNTGFSMNPATTDGWAQRASAEGYAFDTSWDVLKRRYPRTASLSNVQCEVCHGPGSGHAGDVNGIRVSYDEELCGRCHKREYDLWSIDAFYNHGRQTVSNRSGYPECNGCHTSQGFVADMRDREGTDPVAVIRYETNPRRPPLPRPDRRMTTCQACHDPHRPTPNRPPGPSDPQLRAWGRVQFRNGAIVDMGPAAICAPCHQGATDSRDGSADFNARLGTHRTTAAEMMAGVGGMRFPGWDYGVSPHGIPSRFIVPGETENRWCLTCHFGVQPPPGSPGYGLLGGHSSKVSYMRQTAPYNPAACAQCHPVSSDLRVMARADYDGDGTIETVQDEIQGLLSTLNSAINTRLASLGASASFYYDDWSIPIRMRSISGVTFPGPGVPLSENPVTWASLSETDQAAWTTLYRAAYNFCFVYYDRSGGVHNTGYAVNLLQSSIRALDLNAIPNAAPFVQYP